jgi:hypothetical protein
MVAKHTTKPVAKPPRRKPKGEPTPPKIAAKPAKRRT